MPDTSKRVHLTKRAADAVAPRAGGDVVLWDDEVPGFGMRVKPNGRKSYVLQYRNGSGTSRRVTIGKHGVLTAEGARAEARRLRARVAEGGDPATERQRQRQADSLDAFAKRYLSHHAEAHKKAASVVNDRLLLKLHILPALGSRKLADITREDVTKLHQAMRKTPYAANRMLALLSKMMNLAEKWGARPDGSNPCRHVERFREKRRQRFLAPAELVELGKALAKAERENVEHPSVVPALRLLLFTGARRGEVLGLQWAHVDWEHQCLNLPDSKTGAKAVHLNAPALQVLQALAEGRADDSPWVLRGRAKGRPLVGLPHAWQRIRTGAKLPDVRLHDLRHSFASVAAAEGSSLPIIGALLGHTQPATTARYAHLAADPLREAAERVGARIVRLMQPPADAAGSVVPLRRRRGGMPLRQRARGR
ncbi:tyrosine-type recombinase/integrase [bacterium]|nr:tyrosine-type recombinase/integrase [bacterium]